MSALLLRMVRARHRYRVRRATLPWDELEAEAARQGCSAADIFFDRAGRARPEAAGEPVTALQAASDDDESRSEPRVPWRGLDPRPATAR